MKGIVINMRNFGFGVMRLPLFDDSDSKNVDYDKAYEMIKLYMDSGFSYFDTGYMYHNFYSENVLRDLLVKRFPRESFQLADKLPVFSLKNKEAVPLVFDEQLRRCGVDYFDYYLLHCLSAEFYDPKCEPFGCFEFISEKKKEGKVREIGFSYHDKAELLDRILTEHPEVDFVQLQINYLDWEDEKIQSRKNYEVARRHGKKIVIMEPVKGGTLVNVPDEVVKLFKDFAPERSVASWALRYAAGLPGVFMTLSGMGNMDQLTDNITTMSNFEPLSDAELEVIEKATAIIRSTVGIPCTSCGYCIEAGCPANVNIPRYFELYNEFKMCKRSPEECNVFYKRYSKTFGKASDCIGCGQCEGVCPQHLPIIEHLKKIADHFE